MDVADYMEFWRRERGFVPMCLCVCIERRINIRREAAKEALEAKAMCARSRECRVEDPEGIFRAADSPRATCREARRTC